MSCAQRPDIDVKREQRLWVVLRGSPDMRGVLLERIENAVGSGTPDVHALATINFDASAPARRIQALHTWVELKAAAGYPARATTPVLGEDGLNLEQRNWHLRYTSRGGRSLIVVGVKGPYSVSWDVFTFHGNLHDQVNSFTADQLRVRALAFGIPGLAAALKGPL
jgi:hypothetical protein